MYVIHKRDGTLTKDYSEILDKQWWFYGRLYKSDQLISFQIENQSEVCLNERQKLELDQPIQEGEIFDAIMALKLNKMPGCDGLTLASYCKFYKLLKELLINVYKKATVDHKLNLTALLGAINLIPKKAKDDTLVKNWRPITLLNYDYKIISKLIANRLESVIASLIGSQQTGFLKNRSIHQNILKTMEIISYLNRKNKPGIIAIIDFEKCFDRIEHKAIRGALKYFNFGDYFIDLVFLLFTNMRLFNTNNGFSSKFLNKKRGINQGCNASPGIYLLCSEVMAHLLKNRLKGISYNEIHNILSAIRG